MAAAEQNITFVYEGVDKKGAKVKGEISAKTEAAVKTQLRKQGINNPKIRKKGKGLLGDKMLVISVGSPAKPPLTPGSRIQSKEADDLGQMMQKLGTISNQVEKVTANLERTTGALADEKFTNDLKAGVASLSGILNSINQGEGYVGRALRDPAEADCAAAEEMTPRELAEMLGGIEGRESCHGAIRG